MVVEKEAHRILNLSLVRLILVIFNFFLSHGVAFTNLELATTEKL